MLQRLKYSKKPRWLQEAINMAYYEPRNAILQKDQIDYVVMEDCKFYMSELMDSLVRPSSLPLWFEGVRDTDTVLDIGAGIGSCAIPWAKKAARVVAVEPLFNQELSLNAELNILVNLRVWPIALGRGGRISFTGREKTCPGYSLKWMLEEIGKVDFLKVDVEGAEWEALTEDILSIRELRIEFHIRNDKDDEALGKWCNKVARVYNRMKIWSGTHGWSPYFKDVVYMVASKNG